MALASDALHGVDAAAPVRPVALPFTRLRWPVLAASLAVLAAALLTGVLVGPADLPVRGVLLELLDQLPLVSVDSGLSATQQTILLDVRLPRVVLGALVGALLSGSGASYQGVFRNPLTDPYLLGVAAGAGLGATLAIVNGRGDELLPAAAFLGGVVAVAVTALLGAGVGRGRSTASVLLAGVAVAAFFTAVQTYVQQKHADTLREVYNWILGRLTTASWDEVRLVLPYAFVSTVGLLLHRRYLDVLRVGEEEAGALGVPVGRVVVMVVLLATVGTAAAVAVSGLIGFVGIIVPHAVRLVAGAGYRIVLPVAFLGGAAFLVLADVIARSIDAPAEVPIGVVTALVGAPFFLVVLRTRSRV